MISIVTYGRNDNYGFNLVKRTAQGFNSLAEVLTEEDEILFTDYNTPDHLPTLPEAIWDTLTDKAAKLVKVIRISSALHEQIKGDSPLPILENVARNAAIIRSNPQSHWILATNPDVLLVLDSRWRTLRDLLETLPDSFYEMPRFDIPESVWSALRRDEPQANSTVLKNWLISNKAAVAETVTDWRFQPYLLFDAPGDFQLAPRSYFFKLRGFDESMNKYLHSDSNLAKRMWLLNENRTDHLLGNLWVLHQDHYLTGEWAKNLGTIPHNDFVGKTLHQEQFEANGRNWGLSGVHLPMFSLGEKVNKDRAAFFPDVRGNGHLAMTEDVDWTTEPMYRLSHYHPDVLMLYLRENLRVAKPESLLAYVGKGPGMPGAVARAWDDISPSGVPVYDLAEVADKGESLAPDILLVDCYYERSDNCQRRVRLEQQAWRRQSNKGTLAGSETGERVHRFTHDADMREWERGTVPLWQKVIPHIEMGSGATVILLGSNPYSDSFRRFKDIFATRFAGDLRILYVHHRLVVMRVN